MTKSKKKVLNEDQLLMQAFRFTQDDLASLYKGHIDSEHRKRIWRRDNVLPKFLYHLFVFIVLMSCSLTASFFVFLDSAYDLVSLLVMVIIPTFGIALMFGWLVLRDVLLLLDLRAGDVDSTHGLAVVLNQGTKSDLKINEMTFRMPRKRLLVIKPMQAYRIYYLRKSKIVVSVEPMQQ